MPGTIEKATFDRDHLEYIRGVIRRPFDKVRETQIEQLEKHIKTSKDLENRLKAAIAGFDNAEKELKKIRRSITWKRMSTMTKKGYDAINAEVGALKTLEDAHRQRKEHLEYIRQTRGEARDYVREWKRARTARR